VYKRQIYQIAESNRIETFFARIGMLGTGTFRSHALSFTGTKRPHSGRFVPGNESVDVFRSRERNCLVTFS